MDARGSERIVGSVRVLVSVLVPPRLLATSSHISLHGRSRSTVDMINCCQHRCSVHVSSCSTVYVERSETVVDNACPLGCTSLFFTDRVSQTSAPAPTKRSTFMEVVCEQNVAHHDLSQPMFIELKIINLFGGCCDDISASAGASTDSTCSATFVRCVVQASSLPMSQVESLTSMTFSRIRREPKRSSTKRGQISTLCLWFFFQHGSDHRSVALPFHLRVRVVLASGHRPARPNKTKLVGLPSFFTDGTQKPRHKQRDRVDVYRAGCARTFLSHCLSCMIAARDELQEAPVVLLPPLMFITCGNGLFHTARTSSGLTVW